MYLVENATLLIRVSLKTNKYEHKFCTGKAFRNSKLRSNDRHKVERENDAGLLEFTFYSQ